MGTTISEQLAARREVSQLVSAIYEAAERCASLCLAKDVPLPPEVANLLGVSHKEKEAKTPPPSNRPVLAPLVAPFHIPHEGWISIPIRDVTLGTLILWAFTGQAVLSRKQVVSRVRQHDPVALETSFYANYKRMAALGILSVTGKMIRLLKPEFVPHLIDDRLWGPREIFQPTEIATHRREGLLLSLATYGALVRSEMIYVITRTPWIDAPRSESLIQNDLKVLSEKGIIKRAEGADNDWRWELVAQETETAVEAPKATATLHRIGGASR